MLGTGRNLPAVAEQEDDMAVRSYHVKKARKPQGTCRKCGTEIKVGDGYYWWSFRFGPTYRTCNLHPPSSYDKEGNSKRRALMMATDKLADARDADTPDTAAEALREALDAAQEACDGFAEALDAWSGTNFESSDMYASFEAGRDDLESWMNDAESVAIALEDGGQCGHCSEGRVDCVICSATGKVDCRTCEGGGELENDAGMTGDCDKCDGTGEADCAACDGMGAFECSHCGGTGLDPNWRDDLDDLDDVPEPDF